MLQVARALSEQCDDGSAAPYRDVISPYFRDSSLPVTGEDIQEKCPAATFSVQQG